MVHQMSGAESKNGTTEAQINLKIVLKIQANFKPSFKFIIKLSLKHSKKPLEVNLPYL